MSTPQSVLEFYKTQGALTDLSGFSSEIAVLSHTTEAICQATQNCIIHDSWLERYGTSFDQSRFPTASCSVSELLEIVKKETNHSPFENHSNEDKVIACCRDFSLLATALFRAKGIPARARCGFATYLAEEGRYGDHWICEVFKEGSWGRIDPQIDSVQLGTIQTWAKEHPEAEQGYREILLSLNPLSLTDDDFWTAGKAWQFCRKGKIDPNLFGIGTSEDRYGLWFVRGNLIRDFLALCKIELDPYYEGLAKNKLYWDEWQLVSNSDEALSVEDWRLLDSLAYLTSEPDQNLHEILSLYETTNRLHPPGSIFTKTV